MTRRIYSEDLVLNLIVNGKETQAGSKKMLNELYKIDRETQALQQKLAGLELKIRQLDKTSASYANNLKKLEAQKKAIVKQINANNAAMNKMRQEIGRNGLTINQLSTYLKVLNVQFRNTTDKGALANLRREIRLTEDRITHLTTGASRMSIAFERMGTIANKFGTVMSWVAIGTFLFARAVGGTIKNLRDLDKLFSAVMKTTGLTREEMWKLKDVFDELNKPGDMKTPTSTRDLLEIARIAGRLGVRGVEDVAAFTLAVDKLYVSLGEDLKGTVEEVAEKVGKLVNVFRLTEEMPLNEALLRAGSLVNELGKRSAASAETVLNYTARLGGVGSMAKFTIDQLAGLGAALDAMNVPAERGSTALVKLITGLGQHADKFARILGVTIGEYRQMLETDVNGVLLAMLEASRAGNESIMGVVESMGDMEVSGVRVAEVFGKLTQNLEFVREQQEIARIAFESSASVMNEYYIVTKDFNSLMAIQGKRVKAMADDYSKAVAPALYKVYRGFIDLVEKIRDIVVWIAKHNHLVKAMIAVWVAFKASSIAAFIKSNVEALKVWVPEIIRATRAKIANIAATNTMIVAYKTAGGGVAGLTAALRVLWATMLANPVTALVAVIGLAVSAFFLFKGSANDVTKALKGFNAELDSEAMKMKAVFDQVQKTNDGTAERIKGIQLINERYGQYLPKLLSEKSSLGEIATAQRLANDALKESIALKWRDTEFEKINEKYRTKRQKEFAKFYKAADKLGGAGLMGQAMFEVEELIEKLVVLREQGFGGAAYGLERSFTERWSSLGISVFEIEKMIAWGTKLYGEQRVSLRKLDEASAVYLQNLQQRGGQTLREMEQWQTMPEGIYEATKSAVELEFEKQKAILQQRMINEKKGEEWLNNEIMRIEETMLRDMLKLEEQKWTKTREVDRDGIKTKEEVLIGGEKEINDALLKLNENLIRQMKEPRSTGRATKEKDDWKNDIKNLYTEIEIEYQKAYLSGLINKEAYDRLMLSLEFEYKKNLLEELRARGEDTIQAEQEIWNMRIKQKEKQAKDAEAIEKIIYDMLNPKLKKGDTGDPFFDQETQDLADRLLKQKQRIRQFLGLEKDEELEPGFAAFETSNFAEQFRKLEEWYALNITKHDEYERIKTDITKNQMKERAKIAGELLSAIDGIFSSYSRLQQARMEQELESLGDNEAAKDRVRKEYAAKEKKLAIAQAMISGSLAIMQILSGKISGNPLIDSIIKGVLIAATVVTTGMQVATIKAQQFAKGNYAPIKTRQYAKGAYPVMGKDDGKMYNAEYVGRPTTGIYNKPSLGLFAEKPEMVIDWPTLRKIQFNNPALIDAIMAHRPGGNASGQENKTTQYAAGNYPTGNAMVGNEQTRVLAEVLERNNILMEKILKWKPTVYAEDIQKRIQSLENIENNRGM